MRIAIVSTPFIRVPPPGYGGTELFCYDLAEELQARGHDVTLFTTGDSAVSCAKRWLYAAPEWPPTPHDEVSHAGERAFSGAMDRAIATMACHGSLRAGDAVAPEEAKALLKSLDEVDFAGHCPHGRPVVMRIGWGELEHRVGRR